MARLSAVHRRLLIAGGLVLAVTAAAILAWPHVQRYTGAAPPAQYYHEVHLDGALTADYPRVLGAAHNAGNNMQTLRTALRYGADVIEIDMISARGDLVAGRDQPWSWLALPARPPAAGQPAVQRGQS
jgi:hypothetical protein